MMRFSRFRLALAAAALTLLGAGAAQAACTANMSRAESLNIRPTPGLSYRPIGRIPGEACGINVLGCKNGWCQLTYRGVRGFSSSFYLQPEVAQRKDDDVARAYRNRKRGGDFDKLAGDKAWVRVGALDIERGRERAVIQMDREDGRFDTLRMRLFGGPVMFIRVTVVYGNGESENLMTNRRIPANADVGKLDLSGSKGRFIDRIVFDYAAPKGVGRFGQIEVWARKANAGAGAGAGDSGFGDRWEKLGQREVSRAAERDVITLTRRDGSFDKLGLRARKNDVRIYDVRVRFQNGREQRLNFDRTLKKGESSDAINLRGKEGRFIASVTFAYRTVSPGPNAEIELWGRP